MRFEACFILDQILGVSRDIYLYQLRAVKNKIRPFACLMFFRSGLFCVSRTTRRTLAAATSWPCSCAAPLLLHFLTRSLPSLLSQGQVQLHRIDLQLHRRRLLRLRQQVALPLSQGGCIDNKLRSCAQKREADAHCLFL